MVSNRDPRINWELGWKAICKRVKSIKKIWEEAEGSRVRPKDLLFDLRVVVSLSPNSELIARMKVLEDEVQKRERRSTNLWHIRNRSMWLKIDDTPCQYFFKLVTTKRIRESLKIIFLPDGHLTKDNFEILMGVTLIVNFFTKETRRLLVSMWLELKSLS